MKPIIVVAILASLSVITPALAGMAYLVHRIGSFNPPGILVRMDTDNPGAGTAVGNIGLGNIGTMDYFADSLWAVSGDNDKMSFYTIDPTTATATFRSSFDGPFGGTSVFSGSFDNNGNYWVVDFINDVIRKMNPWTGTSLSSAPIDSNAGYNGVAFIGNTLYAVKGGIGDPLQLFGTIDTSTGVFSPIGRTFVGVNGLGGGNGTGAIDYDPSTDTMYLVYRSGVQPGQLWSLYTVDIDTGASSFIGEIQPRLNYDSFAVVPEPGTILLLISSGALIFLPTRRRRLVKPR